MKAFCPPLWAKKFKIAFVHLQRLEDILVDIDLVIVGGQQLSHPPERDNSWIRIAVTASRFEKDLGVGQHGRQLGPELRFVRLPFLSIFPNPC